MWFFAAWGVQVLNIRALRARRTEEIDGGMGSGSERLPIVAIHLIDRMMSRIWPTK
jgi:hypothetical protein